MTDCCRCSLVSAATAAATAFPMLLLLSIFRENTGTTVVGGWKLHAYWRTAVVQYATSGGTAQQPERIRVDTRYSPAHQRARSHTSLEGDDDEENKIDLSLCESIYSRRRQDQPDGSCRTLSGGKSSSTA